MKPKFNRFWSIALLFSIVLLSACEDGEPGPGFTEATRYGNIVIDLSGKRPDGVDFTKSINFKFTPIGTNGEGYGLSNSSAVYYDGPEFRYFELVRFSGMVENAYLGNKIELEFFDNISDQPGRGIYYVDVQTVVEIDNTKFFNLYLYDYEGEFFSEESIKSYSYNPETGKLSFVFEAIVPSEYNSTNYDLTVKITGNVTVLERIDGNFEGGV